MKGTTPAEIVYDGPWHYQGYHGVKSVCYLRLYQPKESDGQPKEPRPAIAIFTEIESNPGTSITNRVEVLATLAWQFLQKPDAAPVVIEHYPNRGVHNTHTDRWQFPESFDFVEFDKKPDGSFEKPTWRRIPHAEVEKLIGKPFQE
ncbi:hypothetical protein [Armatimonas sp.]|uniref:hypothetical protein n=1 Tax=Armatimonas sp. TaxID=1872638 RepID=UPI00286B8190|nr:hypothetical protein [Armatimonas sp.]